MDLQESHDISVGLDDEVKKRFGSLSILKEELARTKKVHRTMRHKSQRINLSLLASLSLKWIYYPFSTHSNQLFSQNTFDCEQSTASWRFHWTRPCYTHGRRRSRNLQIVIEKFHQPHRIFFSSINLKKRSHTVHWSCSNDVVNMQKSDRRKRISMYGWRDILLCKNPIVTYLLYMAREPVFKSDHNSFSICW